MTQSSESAREEAKIAPPASGGFDQTSIILHWVTVLLIVVQFSSAWLHETLDHNSGFAATLLDTHRNSGVLIWIVSMARLVWRRNYAYLPPFPESMSRLQQTIAKANEHSLYALLLVQPITGLGGVLLRGAPFDLFEEAHEFGANALLALIGLHAGAALFHRLILRDGVLQRMLPWNSRAVGVGEPKPQPAASEAE